MKNIAMLSPVTRILMLFGFAFLALACSKSDNADESFTEPDGSEAIEKIDSVPEVVEEDPLPNIFEMVDSMGEVSIFLEALELGGSSLLDAFSSDGPYTVFVPSNTSFDSLFAQLDGYGNLSDFNEATEMTLLTEILEYHIIEGNLFSDTFSDDTFLTTLQGEGISITVDNGIFLEDKTGTKVELSGTYQEATNGVVYVIDKIVLPDAALAQLFPQPTIAELIQETDGLSLFQKALAKTDLADILNGEGAFTLFAPTDDAVQELFVVLGDEYKSFDDFKNPIELQILKEILLGHVVEGKTVSEDFEAGTLPTLLANDYIELTPQEDTFVIQDASGILTNFVALDLEASNGTVHTIDKILIPKKALAFVE